jgi:hypothetical protein
MRLSKALCEFVGASTYPLVLAFSASQVIHLARWRAGLAGGVAAGERTSPAGEVSGRWLVPELDDLAGLRGPCEL